MAITLATCIAIRVDIMAPMLPRLIIEYHEQPDLELAWLRPHVGVEHK